MAGVVVGVDGAGRTHRLGELASAARGRVVWVTGGPLGDVDAATTLVVDDPHRLDDATLDEVVAAGRRGSPVLLARRPTIDRPALAALDEVAAVASRVERLRPLDEAAVGRVIATALGRAASPDLTRAVLAASAGLPAIAALLAADLAASQGAAAAGSIKDFLADQGLLVAESRSTHANRSLIDGRGDRAREAHIGAGVLGRVQRGLARVTPAVAAVARVGALRLDLSDLVVGHAAGVTTDDVADAGRELRDAGFLVPDRETMIPAVAAALLADLAPAQRRRLHDAVARALLAAGADPVTAAGQLRAARITTPDAADVYRTAADRLRLSDPATAIGWYDDATDAGADPSLTAPGRYEAAALLGLPVEPDPALAANSEDARRIALVAGAVAAQEGRAGRAVEALLPAGGPGPLLAVPALVALGRLSEADRILAGTDTGDDGQGGDGLGNAVAGEPALRRLAESVRAAVEPATAVPLLIEAAEAAERTPPAVVLPDSPHAWGAVVAVAASDAATAEHLLGRALAAGIGGPAAAQRHRLLLAWVRLRSGRYDTAVAELRRAGGAGSGGAGSAETGVGLPGREALLVAALRAGLARRSGYIAKLREAWAAVEPVLARQAVDLFQVEQIEEFGVAATRLRQQRRFAPVLDRLDGIVAALGAPPAWSTALGWIRLQIGVAADDPEAVRAAAGELSKISASAPRQRAQAAAATLWARAMDGDVDSESVVAAADALASAELPWEASRLAGHAAIRTTDPGAARRLLEVARDLSGAEPEPTRGPTVQGLSEREVEVARLVLDGRTHKEIGAQLYISPKTVEHHVARIRTKVGATDRAEFVAALRRLLEPGASHSEADS